MSPLDPAGFPVQLPSGGTLYLQSPDEVEMWTASSRRYQEEYIIQKGNDLVTLGTLLQQQIVIYRCQVAINGMEPEFKDGQPTGHYRRVQIDGAQLGAYQKALTAASSEMRSLEKQLGIDKSSREAGGTHTIDSYLTILKRKAHSMGVHITKRTLRYEKFVNELRWRMRMLKNADAEDKAYHNISAKTVLQYVWEELAELEEVDKQFAHEQGRLYAGKL